MESLKTPDAILKRALQKESEARDLYDHLAANCSVDFVKEMLLKLKDEETKHVRMIENMLARLESGMSF